MAEMRNKFLIKTPHPFGFAGGRARQGPFRAAVPGIRTGLRRLPPPSGCRREHRADRGLSSAPHHRTGLDAVRHRCKEWPGLTTLSSSGVPTPRRRGWSHRAAPRNPVEPAPVHPTGEHHRGVGGRADDARDRVARAGRDGGADRRCGRGREPGGRGDRPLQRPAGRRRRDLLPGAAAPHPVGRDAVGRRRRATTPPPTSASPSSSGNALLLTRGGYDAERRRHRRGHAALAHPRHHPPLRRLQPPDRRHRMGQDAVLRHHLPALLRARRPPAVGRAGRRDAAATSTPSCANRPRTPPRWAPATTRCRPAGRPTACSGGYVGDTKLEEMGVYAQSLAPALAWAADDPRYPDWDACTARGAATRPVCRPPTWPTRRVVDGVPVSANTAQNLYDTFIVENHGSFGPHYQCELWRTSGRNAVHFLAAGRPLPEVLTAQPNADRLWRTLLIVMSDAGEPLMPMVNDREHLYGRDVIPLAFLAQVLGDRAAARAEAALAERLRRTRRTRRWTGSRSSPASPSTSPRRAPRLAISYLLHEWRAAQRRRSAALTADELFAAGPPGVTGLRRRPGPGRPPDAARLGGGGDQAGLREVRLATRARRLAVRAQRQHADVPARHGGQGRHPHASPPTPGCGTASTPARRCSPWTAGTPGFTTLPAGEVVYATTGTGAGEGHLEVHNLTMPGVAGPRRQPHLHRRRGLGHRRRRRQPARPGTRRPGRAPTT